MVSLALVALFFEGTIASEVFSRANETKTFISKDLDLFLVVKFSKFPALDKRMVGLFVQRTNFISA